jgi:hypothetical protein
VVSELHNFGGIGVVQYTATLQEEDFFLINLLLMTQPAFIPASTTSVRKHIHAPLTRKILSSDDNASETLLMNEHQVERYLLLLKNNVWRKYDYVNTIDQMVRNGKSIEEAFGANGYSVMQNMLAAYTMPLHEQMDLYFSTGCADARVTITEYVVQKDELVFSYAISAEVYSPLLYNALVPPVEEASVRLPSLALLKLYFSNDEPWACARSKQDSSDEQRGCPFFVSDMKEKLHDIIWDALPLLLLMKK